MHGKLPHLLHKIMHVLELFLAVVALIAVVGALGVELLHIFHNLPGYFSDLGHALHNLLTIVVGLEFVKLLLDTTPGTVLEVLAVAIARHVVLSHENPWSNIACVACVVGLLAVRHYLLAKKTVKEEQHT